MLYAMGDPLRHKLPKEAANSDRPEPEDDSGRVVPLWPHRLRKRGRHGGSPAPQPPGAADRPPVEDIAKYEHGRGDDDYRHRMLMNVLGFAACLVLALAGIWLAVTIAELRKNQDCVLSGRRNCAHVDEPSRLRF
jgi:hypothetical protein